jgi:hypothetical protein
LISLSAVAAAQDVCPLDVSLAPNPAGPVWKN